MFLVSLVCMNFLIGEVRFSLVDGFVEEGKQNFEKATKGMVVWIVSWCLLGVLGLFL